MRRSFLLFAVCLALLLSPGCASQRDYYVSLTGSDTTGNGSSAYPWRTIQHAIDTSSALDSAPRIHVTPGTYEERITVGGRVAILGAGVDQVEVRNTLDDDFVFTINGPGLVRIEGLTVHGRASKNPGIKATNGSLIVADVRVYQPGGWGIVIHDNLSFEVRDTSIDSGGELFSDVGIDIQNNSNEFDSIGTIRNLTAGDYIDHIINIQSRDCVVTIADSDLTGSPVYYADGIRIGPSDVTVLNTTIRRPSSQPLDPAGNHNRPFAGIEVATSSDEGIKVLIRNSRVSGFDVGIGVNMVYNQLTVRNSEISGRSAAVGTMMPPPYALGSYPEVDFGGGGADAGGNSFGTTEPYAFVHDSPYDVRAYGNEWGVPPESIPDRIYDYHDQPAPGGRVLY